MAKLPQEKAGFDAKCRQCGETFPLNVGGIVRGTTIGHPCPKGGYFFVEGRDYV